MKLSAQIRSVSLAAAVLALAATGAAAHPHVWVTLNSSLVFAPDGTVTVEIEGRHVGVGAFASERILVSA